MHERKPRMFSDLAEQLKHTEDIKDRAVLLETYETKKYGKGYKQRLAKEREAAVKKLGRKAAKTQPTEKQKADTKKAAEDFRNRFRAQKTAKKGGK